MNKTDSMIEAEIWTISEKEDGNSVALSIKDPELIVPLFLDDGEIKMVLRAMEGIRSTRPQTQDLLMNFIRESGFEVIRMDLYGVKDNLVQARLVFAGGGRSEALILDAQPSDALALAIRTQCRIYVSRKVADTLGIRKDFL
ncbi:hypothetical protein AGMMS49928_24790 [Spirochaetia bacterium]|nr:hypothetical protein AGMMS49928_24790 [Spirochaetia bacterium]